MGIENKIPRVYTAVFTILLVLCNFSTANAKLALKEIRTASMMFWSPFLPVILLMLMKRI